MTDTPLVAPATAAQRRPWIGWAMALISTASFSLAPTVGKAAIDSGMNPTTLLALRLVITTGLLGVTIAVTDPKRFNIDRTGLLACSAAGLANGVGMLAFFWSLTRIDASVASMLFSLTPLVVLALLALRGEKFTYRNTMRVALGLAGVSLLIGPGGQVDGLGILLALVPVFTVPIQLIVMQWYVQDHDSSAVTLYMVATMAVVAAGWWLVQGMEWHNPGRSGWLAVGVLVLVSTYLARMTMFVAVRDIGGGQVGLLAPVETLLTVIWSFLLLNERLTALQALGGGLILLSALLAVRRMLRVRWRKET